jgi:hypothetical protein
MGLVGEQMLVENSRSAGSLVLGATAKYMVWNTAEHTAIKSDGVSTLEIGNRVNREFRSSAGGRVAAHRFFGRRKERASGRKSADSSGRYRRGLSRKGSGEGSISLRALL